MQIIRIFRIDTAIRAVMYFTVDESDILAVIRIQPVDTAAVKLRIRHGDMRGIIYRKHRTRAFPDFRIMSHNKGIQKDILTGNKAHHISMSGLADQAGRVVTINRNYRKILKPAQNQLRPLIVLREI